MCIRDRFIICVKGGHILGCQFWLGFFKTGDSIYYFFEFNKVINLFLMSSSSHSISKLWESIFCIHGNSAIIGRLLNSVSVFGLSKCFLPLIIRPRILIFLFFNASILRRVWLRVPRPLLHTSITGTVSYTHLTLPTNREV